MKELIFVASSLALSVEKFSAMVLENWFVVSEKWANFCYRDSWQL